VIFIPTASSASPCGEEGTGLLLWSFPHHPFSHLHFFGFSSLKINMLETEKRKWWLKKDIRGNTSLSRPLSSEVLPYSQCLPCRSGPSGYTMASCFSLEDLP
jgi:hypothetical protein